MSLFFSQYAYHNFCNVRGIIIFAPNALSLFWHYKRYHYFCNVCCIIIFAPCALSFFLHYKCKHYFCNVCAIIIFALYALSLFWHYNRCHYFCGIAIFAMYVLSLYTLAVYSLFDSAVPVSLPHCTVNDMNIRGFHIPKGTIVFSNMISSNMDDAYWENAQLFDPTRFLDDQHAKIKIPPAFMPFSIGRYQRE